MKKVISITKYETPYGNLLLGTFKNHLCLCDWTNRKNSDSVIQRIEKHLDAKTKFDDNKLLDSAKKQLSEYFDGNRKEFDIPLLFCGTDFQKKVWKQLEQIPFGKTISYKTLSLKMKNEKAIRAIASANGANALSIFIPCHRVIGANQKMVGYAGGLQAKKQLLGLEGAIKQKQLSLF